MVLFGSSILLLAACYFSKQSPSFQVYSFFAMDAADNIVGHHHVDYEVIKKFQQLDSQYSAKKFQKLEERFTTPIIILPTKPPKTMTVKKVETKTSSIFFHHHHHHDDEENE